MMNKIISLLFIFIFCLVFFSYKLTQVPSGLTGDESAFGYNAILLSRNLRDENNRFLPVFVLSLEGKDWRQPVTQYFITAFFKVFGASVLNLRFTSVIVAAISSCLLFLFASKLLGKFAAWYSLLFFVTTPLVMIQSHLALDNIYPIPFILLWLIFLYLYEEKKDLNFIILSALSLGVGFYSYKGMRSFVPVWGLATLAYLLTPFWIRKGMDNAIKMYKPAIMFLLALLPFFLIIPFLEFKYAGAVLQGAGVRNIKSVYEFLYYYFSSYDPSFLYIKGDEVVTHSTGIHGMYLLAGLPFFVVGLARAIRENRFWKFIVVCFFTGPLLFGAISSYHRASRLMELIPMYALICALGALYLAKGTALLKSLLVLLTFLLLFNFTDFYRFYLYSYNREFAHTFNSTEIGDAYRFLQEKSAAEGLEPYTDAAMVKDEEATAAFFREMYFDRPLKVWEGNYRDLPGNALLLDKNSGNEVLIKAGEVHNKFYFYTSGD